jgi:hypothetical protein
LTETPFFTVSTIGPLETEALGVSPVTGVERQLLIAAPVV